MELGLEKDLERHRDSIEVTYDTNSAATTVVPAGGAVSQAASNIAALLTAAGLAVLTYTSAAAAILWSIGIVVLCHEQAGDNCHP